MITPWKKYISVAALLGIFLQSPIVLAIDIPGTLTNTQNTLNSAINTGQNITGVRLDTVLAAAGLSNEKFKDCLTPNLLGSIADAIKNFDNILKDAVADFINQMFSFLKSKLIFCSAGGIIKKFTGAGIDCTASVVDQASATLKNIKNREIQQSFIANCIARIGEKDTVDLIDQYLQQNGPYGSGPDWVQRGEDIPRQEADRARRRVWAELVNTDICPYMRDQIYSFFEVPKSYIKNPPPVSGMSVDSDNPFTVRAACTLPPDFIPGNTSNPSTYIAMVNLLTQPQNSPQGLIEIVNAELAQQTTILVNTAINEANSGGGLRPVSDCTVRDSDGFCLVAGPNKQVPATLDATIQAARQADMNQFQKDAMDDLRIQIANRLFDLANAPLPLHIELGPQYNVKNFQNLAPTPLPSAIPGSGAPNDPVCTGGNPDCTCLKNNTDLQTAFTDPVAAAMAAVMQNNSSLFSPPGSSTIAPGVNYRTVLQALCTAMNTGGTQICTPHPSQDNEIILNTGTLTISIDVITPDGSLRTNGGQPILACSAGIQN